jgi:hypothetical protein
VAVYQLLQAFAPLREPSDDSDGGALFAAFLSETDLLVDELNPEIGLKKQLGMTFEAFFDAYFVACGPAPTHLVNQAIDQGL